MSNSNAMAAPSTSGDSGGLFSSIRRVFSSRSRDPAQPQQQIQQQIQQQVSTIQRLVVSSTGNGLTDGEFIIIIIIINNEEL